VQRMDVTILTDHRYVSPGKSDPYIRNILVEDELVASALERKGLKVWRTSWDDPWMDWSTTDHALFRSTWDYFDRFEEFDPWLDRVSRQTTLVNPYRVIRWNLDKHYLGDLARQGINIPPTLYIEPGWQRSLDEIFRETGWREAILKPVVSGAARHTYRIVPANAPRYETLYRQLIGREALMLQEFQHHVISRGEVAFMLFGGKFSHAILKRARKGDFRVQEDFGGTVHPYDPTPGEITFAEDAVAACVEVPVYARVDVILDNSGRPSLSELELIEPELWFRYRPAAADLLADAFTRMMVSGPSG